MASVEHSLKSSPEAVFAVLADGWLYSNWVVGASHMRAVDPAWPAVGSKLHHASGVWPLVTRDESVVEEVVPNQRLVLRAKGGVLGEARVVIDLAPHEGGCVVTMSEVPVAGLGRRVHNRLTDAFLARRNHEALARLSAVAERRAVPVEG